MERDLSKILAAAKENFVNFFEEFHDGDLSIAEQLEKLDSAMPGHHGHDHANKLEKIACNLLREAITTTAHIRAVSGTAWADAQNEAWVKCTKRLETGFRQQLKKLKGVLRLLDDVFKED